MDMKKILQAMDGASEKKPVEGSNDMKKFLNIMEGKGPLNRLTAAESIALNTYTEYKPPTENSKTKPSLINKYFKEVEVEFVESLEKKQDKATKLAERVIEKINEAGGNYGHPSNFNKHISQSKLPPDSITNMAKKGAKQVIKREETEGVDSVTLDIPLMIRLLEFAREDAKDDMILHKIVERMIGMKEEGQSLSMSDYENIVGQKKDLSEDPNQNLAIIKNLINPNAIKNFQSLGAKEDPRISASRKNQMMQSVKDLGMWEDPLSIIQFALNVGASPEEILAALPPGTDLSTAPKQGTIGAKNMALLKK